MGLVFNILIALAVASIYVLGNEAARRLLRSRCYMLKLAIQERNYRLQFSFYILALFCWWAVLLAFAITYGVEAAKTRPEVVKAVESPKPRPLMSGAENGLYDR